VISPQNPELGSICFERAATVPAKGTAQTKQVLMAVDTSGAETRALLDQILKLLDDGAVLGLKRHDEQATFNAQVSQELQAVQRQIDLTQAAVDEAHHTAATVTAPSAPQAHAMDHRATAVAFIASGLGHY
jgi:hypothetical protein